MTRAEARAAVRATYEEVSGAPSDSDLNTWLDLEHKLFRREIQKALPSLYATTSATQTLSATDQFTLPADFEALIRLERQSGASWLPVDVSDQLAPHIGSLSFREEGATALAIDPIQLVPGTYRLVYIAKTATLSVESGTNGVLLVPDGCEDIIVERVAARARVRLDEDPSPHLIRSQAVWAEQRKALKKRYGRHPVPGLRQIRRW